MPTYIYSKDGVRVEFFARMGHAPQSVFCNGTLYARDIAAEHSGHRGGDPWVNHKSLALMVHPADIPKYERDAKRRGVKVAFDKDGFASFTSRSDWKRYCKAYGFHSLNEYNW